MCGSYFHLQSIKITPSSDLVQLFSSHECYKSRKYLDLREKGFLLKYIQQFPQLHHQQKDFYMKNKVLIFEMLVAPLP